MFKFIVAAKSTYGKFDRQSNYIHNDGYVGATPSKHFSGDCYYNAFYKAKWFDTVEEAAKERQSVAYKKNAFDKHFNPVDFDILKVEINWVENDWGKKYPVMTILK